jgi:hypothetical protein
MERCVRINVWRLAFDWDIYDRADCWKEKGLRLRETFLLAGRYAKLSGISG